MRKETKDLLAYAETLGWRRIERPGTSHIFLEHTASGEPYSFPATASDWRAVRNARADLRRIAGRKSDSGPSATYRHEAKHRDRFNMDAAVTEIENREAEEVCRFARLVELHCRFYELVDSMSGLNPRLDKVQTTRLLAELRTVREELKRIGAEAPHIMQGMR